MVDFTAKAVCDSISPTGDRLLTMQLRYPKFIHGELMTHRVFSRNASSSRAIPTSKYLEEVRSPTLRAQPHFWGKNQKGMQAAEELNDVPYIAPPKDIGLGLGILVSETIPTSDKQRAQKLWHDAALTAASFAEEMNRLGAHKQIVNRLLEPFVHINVLVSATEYMNFFGLRLDKHAQPEIKVLAENMWRVYNESRPKALQPGEWHLPYIDEEDEELSTAIMNYHLQYGTYIDELNIKCSVARCARVSYLSFETGRKPTLEEDLKLYDRLMGAQPLHASPAEHQATPDDWRADGLIGHREYWCHPDQHGNFSGWRQYRKMLPGESEAPLPAEYTKAG